MGVHKRSWSHRRRVLGGAYYQKILSADPIAYWPLWETSGLIARDLVADLRAPDAGSKDGTYVGATFDPSYDGIGDGNTAPFFDGVNDRVEVFTTAFRDDWNGAELSVAMWFKVNPGAWTDSANRRTFSFLADANNFAEFEKQPADNDARWIYRAGGTYSIITLSGETSEEWVHLALTASASDDEVIAYIHGSIQGAPAVGLGTWAGPLVDLKSVIGAQEGTSSPWHGWLAHVAVFDTVLSGPDIAVLATV